MQDPLFQMCRNGLGMEKVGVGGSPGWDGGREKGTVLLVSLCSDVEL